ncbi:hypothetical protein K505DRAFT_379365 [Melanomma pulvis-pyrius CBS 109.77]|uniref:Nephrocystin 3-like N-terminal domain-containing protein n=1 Tax=Melanomma pulvis-pyrius CBS 109.77 TaxID=1314802 RepID=A0A6A6WV22_9PLEO|nr:hypothetical protein K505DRAFT_379365 [Melanomma pulvis-pyrius CBS 109.77]
MNAPARKHVARTGFTELWSPENEEDCIVDIVFVHGLQGHPKRTWSTTRRQPGAEMDATAGSNPRSHFNLQKLFSRRHKNNEHQLPDEDTIYWPEELLPEDCPSARIMTFGYDSDISKFFEGAVNKNNFYDHANDLLRALIRERQGAAKTRPIMFVAHSLGGIIVKQALVDSERAETRTDEKSIHHHAEHIIFLGTPHRGSSYAGWGDIGEKIARAAFFDTNRETLKHLEVHGTELANLERDFSRLMERRTFSIFNFQEALGYKGVKGLNGKVVENWSSQIGDHRSEPSESINANHMNMCRFCSKEDPGYKQVGGEIRNRVDKLVRKHQEELSREHADFLQSLRNEVSEESYSGNDVKDPHDDTCGWLLDRNVFRDWLSIGQGLFWVKGKPGSGKSVLIKYLMEDPDGLLNRYLGSTVRVVKAGYFFRVTRTTLERRTDGLLRALLYQIFYREKTIYQKSLSTLREIRGPGHNANSVNWTNRQLNTIFESIFRGQRGTNHPIRMIFFIDALDECVESELESVMHCLHKMMSKAQEAGVNLGICMSCRPLNSFDREIYQASGWLSLQKENRDAIHTFIKEELASKSDTRRVDNYYGRFAERVAERADGVFLWVALVVPRLRRKIDNGGTLRELEELLDDIPKDLRELFVDILKRIPGSELEDTMRILQLATLVRRRLSLDEFQHALAFQPNSTYDSIKAWKDSPDYLEDGQMVMARLQYYSGGLLEVRHEALILDNVESRYREFLERSSGPNLSPKHATKNGVRWNDDIPDTGSEDSLSISEPTESKPQPEVKRTTSWKRMLDKAASDARRPINKRRKSQSQFSTAGSLKLENDGPLPPQNEVHPKQSKEYIPNDRREVQNSALVEALAGVPELNYVIRHGPGIMWQPEGSQVQERLDKRRDKHRLTPQVLVVRFIHETAKHFFLNREGFEILNGLIEDACPEKCQPNPFCSPGGCYLTGGHEFIANTCASYFRLQELNGLIRKVLGGSDMSGLATYPFARYVVESWLYHISKAEEGGLAQPHLLELLIAVDPNSLGRYVCWAASDNITSWIRWCIENEVSVNDIDATLVSFGRPIKTAVEKGFHTMVELLLQAGAYVNGVTGGPETALRLAERMNDGKMTKLLRNHGGVLNQAYMIPPLGQIVRL